MLKTQERTSSNANQIHTGNDSFHSVGSLPKPIYSLRIVTHTYTQALTHALMHDARTSKKESLTFAPTSSLPHSHRQSQKQPKKNFFSYFSPRALSNIRSENVQPDIQTDILTDIQTAVPIEVPVDAPMNALAEGLYTDAHTCENVVDETFVVCCGFGGVEDMQYALSGTALVLS